MANEPVGPGPFGGYWTDDARRHAEAGTRYVQATNDGDREGAWQAHLDMLEANGYHVPERTGRF